jgi:hypothetical protein
MILIFLLQLFITCVVLGRPLLGYLLAPVRNRTTRFHNMFTVITSDKEFTIESGITFIITSQRQRFHLMDDERVIFEVDSWDALVAHIEQGSCSSGVDDVDGGDAILLYRGGDLPKGWSSFVAKLSCDTLDTIKVVIVLDEPLPLPRHPVSSLAFAHRVYISTDLDSYAKCYQRYVPCAYKKELSCYEFCDVLMNLDEFCDGHCMVSPRSQPLIENHVADLFNNMIDCL